MNQQQNNVSVLFDTAYDRLKLQFNRIDGLDTKVGVTFSLSNGLLIGLVGFLFYLKRRFH